MADTNTNKEWSLQMNVAGLALFEPGSGIDRITPGLYTAKITDSERVSGKEGKADNIRFDGVVTSDGSEKDKTFMVFMSTKQDGEEILRKRWKNLLMSVVKTPANLEQGTATVQWKLFKDKPVYICVVGRDGKDEKGRDLLPNIDFVTREQYERMKAAPQRVRAASAPANGAAAPAGRQEFKVEGGEGGAQTPQPGQPLLE